jgi:DNA-binding transcriptional ArsR family regulator
MDEYESPQNQFTISDVATLKVIADPLRLQILRTLKHPRTVKDIAAELDRPPTKLYYHVNQLEKHGLIQVAATNIVSGIIEKHYQAAARSYRVDDELLSDEEFTEDGLETLVMAILDDTKEEIRRSIKAGLIELSDKAPHKGQFIRSGFRLYPEQAVELGSALESLGEKYEAMSKENTDESRSEPYGFTIALYPIHRREESEKDS